MQVSWNIRNFWNKVVATEFNFRHLELEALRHPCGAELQVKDLVLKMHTWARDTDLEVISI